MKPKILIVSSNYYKDISTRLEIAAEDTLNIVGIKFKKIDVAGVFEIPVVISKNIKKYDGFVALGCVIRGETPHFDYISKTTIDALMNLSVEHKKPIGNGIITCLSRVQADERSDDGGRRNLSKKNKGKESANAVLSVLGIFKNESKWSSSKS